MYGITVEQLVQANPGMEAPGYQLKKGLTIIIPVSQAKPETPTAPKPNPNVDVRQRAIRMGIMLPLHNINNDGKRMIEYYRGVLML